MKTEYVIQQCQTWLDGSPWRDYPFLEYPNSFPFQADADREKDRLAAQWANDTFCIIKRTTTDEEVDDGVRYGYQMDDCCMVRGVCKTEREARLKIEGAESVYRIVKIIPLP